jgi:hypothetical protein
MDNTELNSNNYGFEELKNQFTTEKEVAGDNIIGWKEAAVALGKAFIPGITPGFSRRGKAIDYDDQGRERKALSRRLTANSPEGTLFAKSVEYARALVHAPAMNMIWVTSCNEWHEDTQIEPVVVDRLVTQLAQDQGKTPSEIEQFKTTTLGLQIYNTASSAKPPPRYTSVSDYINLPPNTYITQNLTYEAYEDLYLNVLRRGTILPFFDESFESSTLNSRLSLLHNMIGVTTNPISDGVGGTNSLKLTWPGTTSSPPTMRINLADATFYNYLTIEFQFLSQNANAGDKVQMGCLEVVGGLISATPITSRSWIIGRDYFNNNFWYYGVIECNIMNVPDTSGIVVDFRYISQTTGSSMYLDDVKITGVTSALGATRAPTGAPTRFPTSAPTKMPTKSPTLAPTKFPTKFPTLAPTKVGATLAPTKFPTKAPTLAPTKVPTLAPTKQPTAAPTKQPTVAPTTDFRFAWCDGFENSGKRFSNTNFLASSNLESDTVAIEDKSLAHANSKFGITITRKQSGLVSVHIRSSTGPYAGTKARVTFWFAFKDVSNSRVSTGQGLELRIPISSTTLSTVCSWGKGNQCTGTITRSGFTDSQTCRNNVAETGAVPGGISACTFPTSNMQWVAASCEFAISPTTPLEFIIRNTALNGAVAYVDNFRVETK